MESKKRFQFLCDADEPHGGWVGTEKYGEGNGVRMGMDKMVKGMNHMRMECELMEMGIITNPVSLFNLNPSRTSPPCYN